MIDLKQLIDAGVHFGHKTSRWSPKMAGYIWGARNGVHLIDVSKTAFLLQKAGDTLFNLAKNGGQILLVGTKKSARESVLKAGTTLNIPRVIDRWIGGTLTNNEQVRKAVTRLLHLRDVLGKGELHVGKKELSMLTKEVARLERNVGGIIDMAFPPSALVIVDAKREYSAIREASYLGIPIIGIVDTNTNPEGVTCVIPANDDSPRSVAFIIDYLATRIAAGQAEWEKNKPEPTALSKASAPAERGASRHNNNRPQRRDGQNRPARPERTEKAAASEEKSAEAAVTTAGTNEAPARADKPATRRPMATRKPAAASPAKASATDKKTSTDKPAAKKPAAAKPAVKKTPAPKAEVKAE
jgi:small subunit ribosomal protein S2